VFITLMAVTCWHLERGAPGDADDGVLRLGSGADFRRRRLYARIWILAPLPASKLANPAGDLRFSTASSSEPDSSEDCLDEASRSALQVHAHRHVETLII
jgi:hypothetical protein